MKKFNKKIMLMFNNLKLKWKQWMMARKHKTVVTNPLHPIKDWHYETYQSRELWLQRSLIFNFLLLSMLALTIVAIIILLPLKTTQTALVVQDKVSGDITIAAKVEPVTLAKNWPLTKHLIMQYVRFREAYDSNNIEMPYQHTYAFSDDTVRQQYMRYMDSKNEQSPLNVYSDKYYITVKVNSIHPLNANTAIAKFTLVLHDKNSSITKTSKRSAIVKWFYSDSEISTVMRDRNPLNFNISYYNVDKFDGE